MAEEHERRKSIKEIVAMIEALDVRVTAQETKHEQTQQAIKENTAFSKKAALDSRQALILSRRIDKNLGGFVTAVKVGQKAGNVTIKSAGWIRKAMQWLTPVVVFVGAVLGLYFGVKK